jgi:hypothetical protein
MSDVKVERSRATGLIQTQNAVSCYEFRGLEKNMYTNEMQYVTQRKEKPGEI